MAITMLSFSKAFFSKCFLSTIKCKLKLVFSNSSGLKKVFKKLCVHNGLVLMVGLKP